MSCRSVTNCCSVSNMLTILSIRVSFILNTLQLHVWIRIGFVKAPLELYIPDEFCNLLAHKVKIPMKDQGGSVYKFLTYMNSIFNYPVTYKLKGGSNSDGF